MNDKFQMDPIKSNRIKINDKILRKKLIIAQLEEEIIMEEEALLKVINN